jgi:hypothetical protein
MPWHVLLATTPVYILIGFLLSLALGHAYDRLGVGHTSFARTVATILTGSFVAGALWMVAFYYYRHYGAAIAHSVRRSYSPADRRAVRRPASWVAASSSRPIDCVLFSIASPASETVGAGRGFVSNMVIEFVSRCRGKMTESDTTSQTPSPVHRSPAPAESAAVSVTQN